LFLSSLLAFATHYWWLDRLDKIQRESYRIVVVVIIIIIIASDSVRNCMKQLIKPKIVCDQVKALLRSFTHRDKMLQSNVIRVIEHQKVIKVSLYFFFLFYFNNTLDRAFFLTIHWYLSLSSRRLLWCAFTVLELQSTTEKSISKLLLPSPTRYDIRFVWETFFIHTYIHLRWESHWMPL
jgi:hypothetical protein